MLLKNNHNQNRDRNKKWKYEHFQDGSRSGSRSAVVEVVEEDVQLRLHQHELFEKFEEVEDVLITDAFGNPLDSDGSKMLVSTSYAYSYLDFCRRFASFAHSSLCTIFPSVYGSFST